MEFRIPPPVSDLIKGGVITVGYHITQDGIESFARCTNPHPRLGVTTHMSYTFDEIVPLLSKVNNPSKGHFPLGASQGEDDQVNLMGALSLSEKKDLNVVTRNGLKNALPVDSLSWFDLMRDSQRDLSARAALVADKIGSAKIVSRISSQPALLGVKNVRNLSEWWDSATSYQRFKVLSTSSKAGRVPIGNEHDLTDRFKKRMVNLQCPFRDSQMPLDKTEEEDSDSTYGGVVTF